MQACRQVCKHTCICSTCSPIQAVLESAFHTGNISRHLPAPHFIHQQQPHVSSLRPAASTDPQSTIATTHAELILQHVSKPSRVHTWCVVKLPSGPSRKRQHSKLTCAWPSASLPFLSRNEHRFSSITPGDLKATEAYEAMCFGCCYTMCTSW